MNASDRINSERIFVFTNIEGVLARPGSAHLALRNVLEDCDELWCWAGPFIELAEEFDVALVIRSSWTLQMPLERIVELMPRPLAARVVGSTDPIAEIRFSGIRRIAYTYDVINNYVIRNHIERWCAVDDRQEAWPASELWRLVRPESTVGLEHAETTTALRCVLTRLASNESRGRTPDAD